MTKRPQLNRKRALHRPIAVTSDARIDDVGLLRFRRYCDLFGQYGIDPHADDAQWQLLLREVPGLRVRRKKQSGRPRKVNHAQRVKLYIKMVEAKAKGMPYEKTAYALSLEREFTGINPRTLRRVFTRDKSNYQNPVVSISNEFVSTQLKRQGAFSW